MLDNILNFLQSMPVVDWIFLCVAIFLAISGFIRGGAKILIHGVWSIIGLILATIFYQELAAFQLFDFLTVDTNIVLLINFVIIFIAFILLKFAIYNLLEKIANIHGPCPLNRFIAKVIGFSLAVVLSWYITLDLNTIEVIDSFITNDLLRIFLSFIVVFTIIVILIITLAKLLHIKVGIDRPCPLLTALQPLDGMLNAKNINSTVNNLEGIIFALIKGFVILVILIIINNHAGLISYESSGIFSSIESIAAQVQNTLSNHLLFINKI